MNGIQEFSHGKSDLLFSFLVGKPGTYVLHSSSVSEENSKFAVALSNHSVQVYDINGKLLDEYAHDGVISDVKFCNVAPYSLFTSTLNGKLRVWDSRCQGPVQTFKDNSDGALKPLVCFDYYSDSHLICAGTELFREDSFLLFWDQRSSELLGGYWNSHTDDISQVCFHPSIPSCMASSGVDGLINVFDLSQCSEDEALNFTLNTGSAINKFCWKAKEDISCISTMDEYQMWSVNDASPSLSVTKETLSGNTEVDSMIDSIKISNRDYLVTGANNGLIHLWNPEKNIQHYEYTLQGHSDLVRTISYNTRDDVILTGGEDGRVCFWRLIPYHSYK